MTRIECTDRQTITIDRRARERETKDISACLQFVM
jgi:hypothetical protein